MTLLISPPGCTRTSPRNLPSPGYRASLFEGQRIQRDQELADGDLVELHS